MYNFFLFLMNILLTSATNKEISLISDYILKNNSNIKFNGNKVNIDFFVTGIGITSTSYYLTKKVLQKKYDLIINLGIAGSFKDDIKLGEIVNVKSQTFADFGVDDDGIFNSVFDINLIDANKFPFKNGKLQNETNIDFLKEIKNVNGITVSTVSGENKKILKLINKYNPDIETMESAAFFYICMMENVNFIELRAISNYIETRDKSKWKIDLAISNLNKFIIDNILSK